jgi:hypothetical protein
MPPGVYLLILKRYWTTLIGTAGTWFLYDFVSTSTLPFTVLALICSFPERYFQLDHHF